MTKLEEIIEMHWSKIKLDLPEYEINLIKTIALEFAKHILEEAAENAKTIREEEYDNRLGEYFYYDEIDKQSITDTLNKYL